jgi:hypothetical protein
MEGEKPCCSPGSLEENLSQVLDFIRIADDWVAAVQETQDARRKSQLALGKDKTPAKILK